MRASDLIGAELRRGSSLVSPVAVSYCRSKTKSIINRDHYTIDRCRCSPLTRHDSDSDSEQEKAFLTWATRTYTNAKVSSGPHLHRCKRWQHLSLDRRRVNRRTFPHPAGLPKETAISAKVAMTRMSEVAIVEGPAYDLISSVLE